MMFFHSEHYGTEKKKKITNWQREKNDVGTVEYKRVKYCSEDSA